MQLFKVLKFNFFWNYFEGFEVQFFWHYFGRWWQTFDAFMLIWEAVNRLFHRVFSSRKYFGSVKTQNEYANIASRVFWTLKFQRGKLGTARNPGTGVPS